MSEASEGMSPRYILVTGSVGFIGAHLCRRLLMRGDHVTAVDSLVRGDLPALNGLRAVRCIGT
ncbi:NAD(P)-dependent oxidoreductase [Nonomuraea turkmeniaca]|uniref:NAD(P)-dependent oxidoreductase n=2 Tax=Nonomuraea turkmeniaca TaxID=103838 RepID=A0A5S4EZ83_9ACTN|nr:NAD(P)-dependent oxidoreductase [Nonomuraea turkmeniaca]